MALIIDAYNVLHCTHVLPDRYAGINAANLCELIVRAGFCTPPLYIVCDGSPKPDERGTPIPPPAQLLHAGPGRDADTLIEELILKMENPRQLVVVSNDRRLQSAARRRKALAMPSEVFLRKLCHLLDAPAAPLPESKPGNLGTTDQWMEAFGFSGDGKTTPPSRMPESAPQPKSQPKTPEIPEITSESETDYWIREFGFDEKP